MIVCISKMVAVETKLLPENRTRVLSMEEIARRREQARQRHAERMAMATTADSGSSDTLKNGHALPVREEGTLEERDEDDSTFIAFGRVFSGTLKRGQQVYVLGPKHDPTKFLEKARTVDPTLRLRDLGSEEHVTIATAEKLYLLMGRELEELERVPAGNILGIGGLEEHVLRTATLSDVVACAPFADMRGPVTPILRVALEPRRLADMAALVRGLKLLHQADPCVQVLLQETGEHVLLTAGEVHLERCLNDLTQRFAKVEINVSDPIIPFRETIVEPPKVDMVNEAIEDKNTVQNTQKDDEDDEDVAEDGTVTIRTPNQQVTIKLRAEPLPPEVTELLEKHTSLIRDYNQALSSKSEKLPESLSKNITEFQKTLAKAFADASWSEETMSQIWSFGPRRCGPNVLINRIPGFRRPAFFQEGMQGATCTLNEDVSSSVGIQAMGLNGRGIEGRSTVCTKEVQEQDDSIEEGKRAQTAVSDPERAASSNARTLAGYDHSFVSGFQLATLTGPLCQEPMMGVAFVVDQWDLDLSVEDPGTYGPLSGQIISVVKEGCRRAFQAQPQRLLCAMYSCSIQVTSEALRKMYAVLGRRHGRVLGGDLREGSQMFQVTAVLPVVESLQFANEIRKQTSGLANPQLVFSHWEVVDVDPFWVPSTEEEYAHFGEKADTENRARKYMNAVRKRKGLPVSEKVVEHAEKQRTLSKNK